MVETLHPPLSLIPLTLLSFAVNPAFAATARPNASISTD